MLLPNLDFNPNFEGKVEDKPEINRKDEPVEEDEQKAKETILDQAAIILQQQ